MSDSEIDRHLHHRRMNRGAGGGRRRAPQRRRSATCGRSSSRREDVTDNLRHYTRQTYLRMAERAEPSIVGDRHGGRAAAVRDAPAPRAAQGRAHRAARVRQVQAALARGARDADSI